MIRSISIFVRLMIPAAVVIMGIATLTCHNKIHFTPLKRDRVNENDLTKITAGFIDEIFKR